MYKNLTTTKLYYNRYLYKIVVRTMNLWPSNRWSQSVWRNFDNLADSQADDDRSVYFAIKEILDKEQDYRSRSEGCAVAVFTNNRELLERISSVAGDRVEEIWEPDPDTQHLLKDANTILVKEPPTHPVRVMLNDRKISTDFANWIDENSDKIKIGDAAYRAVKRGWMTGGLYFYIRDDKVLSLVNLMIPHNIRRVDKMVCDS